MQLLSDSSSGFDFEAQTVASGGVCFSSFGDRVLYFAGFSFKRARKFILCSHPACREIALEFLLGIRRAGATLAATVPRSRQ